MYFNQSEANGFIILSPLGVSYLQFFFNEEGEYLFAQFHGLDIEDEDLTGPYLKQGDEYYTWVQAQEAAVKDMEEIVEEMAEEAVMARELSSPYLTGRI